MNDAQRAQLGAIADVLIPAGSGMPSASEAGVAGPFLDEVLAARPDLAAPLAAALDSVAESADAIADLRADAGAWGVITAVVPAAYFLNPAMREAIGYPGLEARPISRRGRSTPTPPPTTSTTGCWSPSSREVPSIARRRMIDCRPCQL
jgi:hypothetical protein